MTVARLHLPPHPDLATRERRIQLEYEGAVILGAPLWEDELALWGEHGEPVLDRGHLPTESDLDARDRIGDDVAVSRRRRGQARVRSRG